MIFIPAASLVVLAVLFRGSVVRASVQQVLSVGDGDRVLSPDILGSIQSIVDAHEVPGLSVALVRTGGSIEYGNWGIRNEAGDAVTSDVRPVILYTP